MCCIKYMAIQQLVRMRKFWTSSGLPDLPNHLTHKRLLPLMTHSTCQCSQLSLKCELFLFLSIQGYIHSGRISIPWKSQLKRLNPRTWKGSIGFQKEENNIRVKSRYYDLGFLHFVAIEKNTSKERFKNSFVCGFLCSEKLTSVLSH